jgi:murein DD-endopeptidase MepM/ murein hydrolase activator NlpD
VATETRRRSDGNTTGGFLSEKELFLKSARGTRYVRLGRPAQLLALGLGGALVAWSVFSAALLSFDALGAGSLRDRAEREREVYESRIAEIAEERDLRAAEARRAQARFASAMQAVSEMQGDLMEAQERREELEAGLETVHATLRRTMQERQDAQQEADAALAELRTTSERTGDDTRRLEEMTASLALMADVLARTAVERDAIASIAGEARAHVDDLILEHKLQAEKNDRIFGQLEAAMEVSVEPLDGMFRKAGLDPERIMAAVRSGRGAPDALGPIRMSTKNGPVDADAARANGILTRLSEIDVYREAAEKTPFSRPVRASVRSTSGFGPRWGRMHNGHDWAGRHGTPIHATAHGTVIHASRLSGYGLLVKVKHEFGIETRYAHLSRIRVKVGQKVSRGDHIGDMGNTGRSTGTHLHYEVRMDGRAVDPMIYIKAAQDVL